VSVKSVAPLLPRSLFAAPAGSDGGGRGICVCLLLQILDNLPHVFGDQVADGGHLEVLARQAPGVVGRPENCGLVVDLGAGDQFL